MTDDIRPVCIHGKWRDKCGACSQIEFLENTIKEKDKKIAVLQGMVAGLKSQLDLMMQEHK